MFLEAIASVFPGVTCIFNGDRHTGEAKARHRAVAAKQVAEAYVVKRAPHRDVDTLPGTAYAAHAFMLTVAVAAAAFGNCDRTFERINDIGCADLMRTARQPVATACATCGDGKTGSSQRFQQLANGRKCQTRGRRNVCSTAHGAVMRRQVGEHNGPVIGESGDSQQGQLPVRVDKGLF